MALETTPCKELLASFFDNGAYTPLFSPPDCCVEVAYGQVEGLYAYAICQNGEPLTVFDIQLCCKTLELAGETGKPVVTFYNSSGLQLTEGLQGLAAMQKLMTAASRFSGVVPQIAVVTGVCGASSALAAASADLCIMAKDAEFFLTPPFLSAAAGDSVENAGGPDAALRAGVVAMVTDTTELAVYNAAKVIARLPANNLDTTAAFDYIPTIGVMDTVKYTAEGAIEAIVDRDSQVVLYDGFGAGVVTALGTMEGEVVGVVATTGPETYLGRHCVAKVARFVRLCDSFSIPLVTILNTGGFKQSASEEMAGSMREAARLASTYADATVAKVAVIAGKAVGPAYAAMGNADLTIALEHAIIAPVEPSAAASVLYREEIEASGNPLDAETAVRAREYEKNVASAKAAQQAGLVDMLSSAAALRSNVASALEILATKRSQRLPKKHGNMPL